MALQLSLENQFGDEYPEAYRRLEAVYIEDTPKTIRLVFNNYKSKAVRDADLSKFFSQTVRMIGPHPVDEVRDENGNLVAAAVPSYDQFQAADAADPAGIKASVYGFEKTRADVVDPVDV